MNSEKKDWVRALGLMTLITTELVGWTVAGIAIGYALQSRLGGSQAVLFVMGMSGFAISIYRIIRIAQQ